MMAYVRKRKGRWYYSIVDESGKRREFASHARTKTEAMRMTEERQQKHERVRLGLEEAAPQPMCFAELATLWLETIAARKRKPASALSRLRCHLLPEFAKDLLTSITAERIERFL